MYSAKDIAFVFVRRGIEEANPLTQMKLQKLIYFAHGLHLASTSSPLIKEQFQAWQFGPVLPVIYDIYKKYGNAEIKDTDWLKFSGNAEIIPLDKNALEMIDSTWKHLKGISAVQLSNWSHADDSPWAKTYKEGVNNIAIPNETIKSYFEQYIIQP